MKLTKDQNIKSNNKGITLVSLVITIAVMLIIASSSIYISMDRFEINNYNKMKNDIGFLSEKVSNYYLRYSGIPVLRDSENNPIEYNYSALNFYKNAKDDGKYYILDLEAMDGLSLNYGKQGYYNPNTSDDVYIINEKSFVIYYVRGVELKDAIYHTIPADQTSIEDAIPPAKPKIKIISGSKNDEGTYISEVEIEIVPGKSNGKDADRTEYSVNGGETWKSINTLTNNIYKIEDDGTYNIKARSFDAEGNTSESSGIEIKMEKVKAIAEGDIVKYDSNNDGEKEDWIIFNLTEEKLEIISKNTMGALTLGYTDPEIKGNLDKYLDIDGDGDKDDLSENGTIGDNADIAIASYNNAISTINAYCRSLVTAKDNSGVRSLGAAIDESGYYDFTEYNNKWEKNYTIKAKVGDTKDEEDLRKMETLGIKTNCDDYWCASRYTSVYGKDVNFGVDCVITSGTRVGSLVLMNANLVAVGNYNPTLGVRPIVIDPVNISLE